jgi:tetratricopeptide (TPR) repeat protein
MAEVTLDMVPAGIRNLFNKGSMALEKGNLDYAMDMFAACLDQEPRLLKARHLLRAAAVRQAKGKKGGLGKKLAEAAKMPAFMSAQRLLKGGKPQEAMDAAEKLLREDPTNARYALLLAEASLLTDMLEAGIMSVEVARENNPGNISVLEMVGDFYIKVGRPRDARECYERLCKLQPNNTEFVKKLKDSMAMDSMSSDGWEEARKEGGSFRSVLRNEEEAAQLERGNKAVKSERDADLMIADMLKRIEAEPENINYYRQVARLYAQKNKFAEAVDALTKALALNAADAELDRTLSETKLKEIEFRLETARAEGADEETLVALENERIEFRFNDLQQKVGKYPNDLMLKFEWGVMLYENDYFNEAIQQFQMAQRNPKVRLKALYYMGLCFKQKGQLDLAATQFETAVQELQVMDAQKKDLVYELGQLSREQGDTQKAMTYFKQIYAVDIGFRDISTLVEQGL